MMPMQPAYKCNWCEYISTKHEKVVHHAEEEHPKEVSRAKIDFARSRAKTEEDQLNLLEAVKEHTLKFLVDESDKHGVYSIDEVLGAISLHEMFQRVSDCGYKGCQHEELAPALVDEILANQSRLRSRGG